MSVQDIKAQGPRQPDSGHGATAAEDTRPENRAVRYRVIRPLASGAVFLSGALGTIGTSLTGHQDLAAGTLAVTALAIAAELWMAKRRDDQFRKVATTLKAGPPVLRALIIYEAVRSRQLTSEDAARLLENYPDDRLVPLCQLAKLAPTRRPG
jgi:hypothetical protein